MPPGIVLSALFGTWPPVSREIQRPSAPENPPATPHELRENVEVAKAHYKAEKERYLKEREARKKDRERKSSGVERTMPGGMMQPSHPTEQQIEPTEEPVVHLVSKERGTFPQLEMFSVPRRHHTYAGPSRADTQARVVQRISRRLSDMGFTENSYPGLPSKIKMQLPAADDRISKDMEDDIVTTLLEELLAVPPKTPVASGSKANHVSLPGAWQH